MSGSKVFLTYKRKRASSSLNHGSGCPNSASEWPIGTCSTGPKKHNELSNECISENQKIDPEVRLYKLESCRPCLFFLRDPFFLLM